MIFIAAKQVITTNWNLRLKFCSTNSQSYNKFTINMRETATKSIGKSKLHFFMYRKILRLESTLKQLP